MTVFNYLLYPLSHKGEYRKGQGNLRGEEFQSQDASGHSAHWAYLSPDRTMSTQQ
jgi:hypothetical protein